MKSDTVEDYLKAIFELQEREGRAKTSQLAERLGVTAGSVTGMLQRLSMMRPPPLTYRHHRGVKLTAEGRKTALEIIRRHRLLETFLHRVLGLSWDEVHREAEILEHYLSDRVTDALDELLQHPKTDPHGEPIPDKDGGLSPSWFENRLSTVDVGKTVKIAAVHPPSEELLRFLNEQGVGIETRVTVLDRSELDGTTTLQVASANHRNNFPLGQNVTDRIFVMPIDPE
jgi:DtxR family Mn-dependent transcriptional regulator